MTRIPYRVVRKLVPANPDYILHLSGSILRTKNIVFKTPSSTQKGRASKAGHRAAGVKRLVARYRLLPDEEGR